MDLAKLRNLAWTEHDGQRLVLDAEQTLRDMLEAAAEIERLTVENENLRRWKALDKPLSDAP